MSGSAISQMLVFLIMPILTRMYSEELFGIYFIFVSTLNILKRITTLRFELAVVLPKKNYWAINALAVAFSFTILSSLFFLLISFLFYNFFIRFEDLKKIADFLFLIPLSLFFIGIFDIANAWNNRVKKYKKIATGKIIHSSTTGFSQLFLGAKSLLDVGLILGVVIGKILSGIFLFFVTINDILRHVRHISFKRMKIILRQYKKIPIYNSLINTVVDLSNEIPTYLLTGFYSIGVAGFYGMANKISATPLDLLGRSIGQVFYQKASEDYNNKRNIENLLRKTCVNVLKISILPILFVIAISPFIYYILGAKWAGLELYILILLPAVFTNFLILPISGLYTIFQKQDKMLVFNVIMLGIKFLAIWSGFYFFNNIIWSLILLSFVSLTFKLLILLWFFKISKEGNE